MEQPRFGTGLWQGITSDRLAAVSELIEEVGFDQLWYANHKLYRDMFVGLAIAAQHTRRIELGTFVAEPYSQHPAQLATAIATVDELSGGRAIFGIGAGGANFVELGLRVSRPAQTIRESVQIVRGLLSGQETALEGGTFSVHGAQLHLPARRTLPIVVASRGDRVLEVAGEVGDGAMISTYATPAGLGHGRRMVERGLERAGRSGDGYLYMTRVDIAIDDDPAAAMNAVRPMIALMVMASYPDTAFLEHAGLELTPELEEMSKHKNEALAMASGSLVPDAYVRQYAWVGTPAQVAEQIAEVVDAGFGTIVVLPQPMTEDPERLIRAFGHEVIPRVRAELALA